MNRDLPEPRELVFAAPENPATPRRALGVLLGVSLVGHALGFYVLQAFSTPAGALPSTPPPARWTLVPAGTPEAAGLARWARLADPALGAGAVLPRPEQVLSRLPAVPYVPSFEAHPPTASWLESLGDGSAPLTTSPPASVLPPAPVLPPRIQDAQTAPTPVPTPRTSIVFPEVLRRRLPPGGAPAPGPLTLPAATLAELPRPVTFLVGVQPEGGAPLVFRETASGIAAADEAARAYLEAVPFTPAERVPVIWGRVTVCWGREVFR